MAGTLQVFYRDEYLKYDFGGAHPLAEVRIKLAVELMGQLGITSSPGVTVLSPAIATADDVLMFHTKEYVDFVAASCARGHGRLDGGDTPAFKGGVEASLLLVGGSLSAVDAVMENRATHAFNPGGGLHHAHPDRASGFCIFNDPASSIMRLKHHYQLERVLYLDIDAHHGDGVMYGFYSDPGVLDIDFHEDGHFLFPGSGFIEELGMGTAKNLKVNIPLPSFSGDDAFLYAFENLVPPLARQYQPQIIMMQCGADSHQVDRLTHLRYSSESLLRVVRQVHELAHELCQGRLVLFGGGRYSLANVARCWALVAAATADIEAPDDIPVAWATEFERQTGEKIGMLLRESPTVGSDMVQVTKLVAWLKERVLPS